MSVIQMVFETPTQQAFQKLGHDLEWYIESAVQKKSDRDKAVTLSRSLFFYRVRIDRVRYRKSGSV